MINFANFNLLDLLMRMGALTFAFTVHELCHGLMALALGDRTAKNDGRLTLNPLRHIDPLGMVFILIFSFGWAKPVMIDPGNFKYPKYDMALTAVAGPISNFLMATASILIYYSLYLNTMGGAVPQIILPVGAQAALLMFLRYMVIINLVLGIFNLIPIPPLDGSKLFGVVLPDRLYFSYISSGSRIGMLLIFILIWTNQLTPILTTLLSFGINLLDDFARFVFL